MKKTILILLFLYSLGTETFAGSLTNAPISWGVSTSTYPTSSAGTTHLNVSYDVVNKNGNILSGGSQIYYISHGSSSSITFTAQTGYKITAITFTAHGSTSTSTTYKKCFYFNGLSASNVKSISGNFGGAYLQSNGNNVTIDNFDTYNTSSNGFDIKHTVGSSVSTATPTTFSLSLKTGVTSLSIKKGGSNNCFMTSYAVTLEADAACSTAPTITTAPSSATYCVGNTATALSYESATANAQKWQVSTDNSEWNDISPAQTGTTYTPSTASAGITYYRVIATCDSYTHSATSSAATITVKANHSVTAATSTGTNTYGTVTAASASVCEGSTTTVTATPASGYQVTNWAVSDDDNGAFISPTGASSSTSTTLTMGTDNATVTVTFGCKAPTSPSISGTTAYTAGQDISLTASATGTSASATYTWYKGETWDDASATSSIHSGASLSIDDCEESDAGTYWCNISNGTGCDVQASKTITVGPACTDPSLTIKLN